MLLEVLLAGTVVLDGRFRIPLGLDVFKHSGKALCVREETKRIQKLSRMQRSK